MFYYIQEQIDLDLIHVEHIPTDEMHADLMTKVFGSAAIFILHNC